MKIKVLTGFFLINVSALRGKRQSDQNSTITVDTLEQAFEELTDSTYRTHGCYCSALADGQLRSGSPFDDADRYCKEWIDARKCLLLKGGACENTTNLPSYTRTESQCENSGDDCADSLCQIDDHFKTKLLQADDQPEIVNECTGTAASIKFDACCSFNNNWDTMKRYDSTYHQCTNGQLAPVPECEVKLVRQSINRFHTATDNLRGTAVYGTPGPDNEFSIRFDNFNIDTYILATKDHLYFQAMTKEEIGGILVSPAQYYGNETRSFRSIEPGFTQWEQNSARMYFRAKFVEPNYVGDPFLSITDHWPRETNKIMYAETNAATNEAIQTTHGHHLLAHGGLQVYVLTKGSYQDCIVDGFVGEFQDGVYVLKESTE